MKKSLGDLFSAVSRRHSNDPDPTTQTALTFCFSADVFSICDTSKIFPFFFSWRRKSLLVTA
jgi:hypothetical protein